MEILPVSVLYRKTLKENDSPMTQPYMLHHTNSHKESCIPNPKTKSFRLVEGLLYGKYKAVFECKVKEVDPCFIIIEGNTWAYIRKETLSNIPSS